MNAIQRRLFQMDMDSERYFILLEAFAGFFRTVKPQGFIPRDQVTDVARKHLEGFLKTEYAAELNISEQEKEVLPRIASHICLFRTREFVVGMMEGSEQPFIAALWDAILLQYDGKITREELLEAIGAICRDAREEIDKIE